MSIWFGLLLFLFLPLAVITFLISRHYRRELKKVEASKNEYGNRYGDARAEAIFSSIVFKTSTALFLVFVLLSSVWFVPVRNAGIVLAFNAPTGRTTGTGLNFTWPWEEVADFDISLQTTRHDGGDKAPSCSNVRIGSLATACVENVIQWQILDAAAPKLYRDYKGDFDNLSNNFVSTKIQNALNAVFATYNPLAQVNIQTGQTSFDGAQLGRSLEEELKKTIGSDIRVISVSIPMVHHDAKTEENIKAFQDVVAKARILQQQTANAQQEKALADLNKQFLTDEYIRNKCVDESVKMGVPPGLCLVGGGAIVNAQPSK